MEQQTIKTLENFLKPALSAEVISKSEYNEIMRRVKNENSDDDISSPSRSPLLTKRKYAELQAVSVATVNRWLRLGWIDFYRTPTTGPGWGHVRIRADEEPDPEKANSNNDKRRKEI